MIRINLIQKKQASYVSSNQGAGAFSGLGKSGLEQLVPFFKAVAIPLVFCVALNAGYDFFIQQRTEEMKVETTKLDHEKEVLNKELEKIRGFEVQKTEIERTELVLRGKLDTIDKLVRGRDFTVKSLVYLAQVMPKDVWMTEMKSSDSVYEFKGGVTDVSLVSDFLSKLQQTIYFKDVSLKNIAGDPSGHTALFELGTKRE